MSDKRLRAKKRRGSTLLLSLLVLSTLLVATVSISQLVAIEAAITRSNNETIVATYAAESALERGAYRVRNAGVATSGLAGSASLENQSSWSMSASNAVAALVMRQVPKNLSRGFDFFDADSPTQAGKESVKITVDSCDGSEWIELGYQSFDPIAYTFGNFEKFRYNCPAGTNSVIYNNGVNASAAYRLYVRYVDGGHPTIDRMTIQGCTENDGGGSCNMQGVIDMTAVGSYRGATRTMSLVLPRLSPVSGVFSYGLFSECQIIKDPSVPDPSCN
jgi:Tfp pilus assembly protein PilX